MGEISCKDAGTVPNYQVRICELRAGRMLGFSHIEMPPERLLDFFFHVKHLASSAGRTNFSFHLLDEPDRYDIVWQYGRSKESIVRFSLISISAYMTFSSCETRVVQRFAVESAPAIIPNTTEPQFNAGNALNTALQTACVGQQDAQAQQP